MHDDSDAHDERLLQEGRIGDALARYLPALHARALARLKPHQRDYADDVVQNAVLRVWREYDGGKRWDHPFRVIVHRRLSWTLLDFFGGRPDEVQFPEDFDPKDLTDHVSDVEDRQYVEQIIAELPPREHEVARMRVIEDRTPAEIAELLGIESNAVHQALFRAWRRLEERLRG